MSAPECTVDRLLTTAEVAALTGFSPSTLKHWRAEDRGPAFVRLARNRGVRYPAQDVAQWVAAARLSGGVPHGC